jgi:hypothetical protein
MHKLVAQAAQNGTYTEAFALGVDFQLVVMVSIQYTAVYEDNNMSQSETAKALRSLAHTYFGMVNEEATKMHITPDDVCQAAEWKDCQNGVMPMFKKWASVAK